MYSSSVLHSSSRIPHPLPASARVSFQFTMGSPHVEGSFGSFETPEDLEVIRENKELSDELLAASLLGIKLPAKARILDFGCGSGTLIREHLIPFAEKNDATVVGLDISQTMIDFAKDKTENSRVEYFCGYADDPALKAGSFDLIVSTFCLDYIPHPERIVVQLERLLAPGGKMWMTISADKKFYSYFKAVQADERFAPYCQGLVEPDWVHDKVEAVACENFYRKHLTGTGLKIVEMKTYPTLGLQYDTVEEYIDFFMWVSMGQTSTPKAMEPALREFCARQVNNWIMRTPAGIHLDWKICNFLVEKKQ